MSERAETVTTESATRLTRDLAVFALDVDYETLPALVIDAIKVYTLDCLGCGFIGAVQPWSRMACELVREAGGSGEASSFTLASPVTAPQAALLNGVMIGGFESEHIGYNAHPAGTAFPAALAMAERTHAPGRSFIAAMAAGYETACRIGAAQTNKVEVERGFHNPAVNGPFSSAVVSAKLLGFDLGTTLNALGIAGSHAAGLVEYAWNGEMTKRLHLGRAAQWGIESALLAQKGFTGPATILEGRYGFFHAFSPSPKPELLLDGLGERWLLAKLMIKAYPCHANCQAIVGAIQQFKRRQPFSPDDVRAIQIRGGEVVMEERFHNPSPANMMGAQYSIPFSLAMAIDRDLDDPFNYDESALVDPAIRRMAGLVTWEEGSAEEFPAREAELRLTIGGITHRLPARTFKGSLSDPLSFADAEDKFHRFAGRALDSATQAAIVERVRNLEKLDDLSELARLIRGT